MDTTIAIVIAILILLLIVTPLLIFYRRSTDVRLEGDLLVLQYPFRKEEFNLTKELISWHLQEARLLRWGRIYALNLELKGDRWRSVSSRFNPESFQLLFKYLETEFGNLRKADN